MGARLRCVPGADFAGSRGNSTSLGTMGGPISLPDGGRLRKRPTTADGPRWGGARAMRERGDHQREGGRRQEHDGHPISRRRSRSRGGRVLMIDAGTPSGKNATLGLFPRRRPRAVRPGRYPPRRPGRARRRRLADGPSKTSTLIPPGRPARDPARTRWGGSQGARPRGRGVSGSDAVLRSIQGYDVAIVDTSPVQTPLNVAILYAVGEVIIPIDPCIAALAGVPAPLEELIEGGEAASDASSPTRDPSGVSGVLITRADRTLVVEAGRGGGAELLRGRRSTRSRLPDVGEIPRGLLRGASRW